MATEQTLDTVNNVNIKNTGEMSGWSSGHRLVEAAQHSTRSDRVAELAYDNQVALQARQQNLALDQDTAMRNISNMFLGALANKFIHMDPSEAISTSQAFKGSSDASILSILSVFMEELHQ